MRPRLVFAISLCFASPALAQEAAQEAPAPYEERALPFLRKYCFECHDARKAEGEVVLDRFSDLASVQRAPRLWKRVRREVGGESMPPEEARARPEPAEIAALLAWIDAALSAPPPKPDPGRVTLRRLNRTEYDNTVRDLFGVTSRPSRRFPDDDTGYGFDTIGDVLSLPPLLMERYLEAAEEVAAEAILVYRPTERRVEAERMVKTAKGGNHDGWASFSTNGDVSVQVRVHHAGSYLLRARACGDQAGPDPCRMAFKIDGRRVAEVSVPGKRDAPEVYEVSASLTEGVHSFAVGFTNDWWRPKNPPGNQDRNLAVDWVELVGPADPPRLPPFHARFVEPAQGDPQPAVEALLERAFRRPVRAGEAQRYLKIYRQVVREEGATHERGLQAVVQAVLVSPSFLFRVEADPAPGQDVRPLDEWELATRLSYFLWASTPDDELLSAARAGELRSGLSQHVARLLDDPRASTLVEHFAGQWLELRRLDEVTPDPLAFPEFDGALRADMREETERFVEAVLREGRSVLDLLRGRFTFVNERLAKHYGIEGVVGPRFRRVSLPPERAGILTHASVLTITSNPTRTSLVKRGKWILEVILDDPPGDPPPGTGDLPNVPPQERSLSLREMLEQHRKDPKCATCHARLDPLGFGLERFDGIGVFRRRDGRFLIDARGEVGGIAFDGARGLRDYILAERREEFVLCLAKKLLVYALGRGPRPGDEAPLRGLVRSLAPEYRFQRLIEGIVRLDAFQLRGRTR